MDGLFESNADPALIELFRAETDTHIPTLNQGLLALEKGQADDQTIASMMRAAHSIKGAARIVGIDAAVRVAHALEDCFTAAGANRAILSSDAADVLLGGVDALQRICALRPDAGMTESWINELLEQLLGVKEGRVIATRLTKTPDATPPIEIIQVSTQLHPTPGASLELPSDFDDVAAGAVHQKLREAFVAGPAKIRIDFRRVRRMSAGALSLLASLARDAGRRDPPPRIVAGGASAAVAALLRVTGLNRTFNEDPEIAGP